MFARIFFVVENQSEAIHCKLEYSGIEKYSHWNLNTRCLKYLAVLMDFTVLVFEKLVAFICF